MSDLNAFESFLERRLRRYAAANERPFDPARIADAAIGSGRFGRLQWPLGGTLSVAHSAVRLAWLLLILAMTIVLAGTVLWIGAVSRQDRPPFAAEAVSYMALKNGVPQLHLMAPDGTDDRLVGAGQLCPQQAAGSILYPAWTNVGDTWPLNMVDRHGSVEATGLDVGQFWVVAPDGTQVAYTDIGDRKVGLPRPDLGGRSGGR